VFNEEKNSADQPKLMGKQRKQSQTQLEQRIKVSVVIANKNTGLEMCGLVSETIRRDEHNGY
jgi:hypothetical protein